MSEPVSISPRSVAPSAAPALIEAPIQPAHALPVPLVALVGRQTESAELQALLSSQRLVTLTGPGGVGKSRLALHLAHACQLAFAHGAYLVPLAAVSAPEHIAPAIADALGFAFYSPRDPQQQLLDYLRARQTLLVLDNFEHLLPAANLLSAWLEQAAGLKLLVTSRERLNVQGEWVFDLGGLAVPEAGMAPDPESYPAGQLFLQVARRVARFTLHPGDWAPVARLCRFVNGLPLAIEMAAAWSRAVTVGDIAAEVEKNLDFLTAPRRDTPERHRSLRVVLDYSWAQLTPHEQEVFRKLSVFKGGFQRAAAESVAGANLNVLTALVDQSFLQWEAATQRYRMHDLLIRYGHDRLAENPAEEHFTVERYGEYYASFLHEQFEASKGKEQTLAYQAIGAELANLRWVWEQAVVGEKLAQVDQMVDGLYKFYRLRGLYQEGLDGFDLANRVLQPRKLTPQLADAPLWRAVMGEGILAYLLGLTDRAENILSECRDAFQALNMPAEVVTCIHSLAGMLLSINKFSAVKKLLSDETQFVSNFSETPLMTANRFRMLGMISSNLGECLEGRRYYEQALNLYQKLGNKQMEATLLVDVGLLDQILACFPAAIERYQRALQLSHEIDYFEGEFAVLQNLSELHCKLGNSEAAEQYGQRAFHLARLPQHRLEQSFALVALGDAWLNQGRYLEAQEAYQQALTVYRELDLRVAAVEPLAGLARVLLHQERLDLALSIVDEVLSFLQSTSCEEIGELHTIYWECYSVLYACKDLRAPSILEMAYRLLQERADKIVDDSLRRSFLENVPANRDLLQVYALLQAQSPGSAGAATLPDPLSEREVEILGLIAAGCSNQDITQRLFVSINTVKTHTKSIFRKLGVNSRTQAVQRARELKLIA
jgi:predicted ATPase/DNA-binding CsgD family transcriptional regulator